VGDPTADDGENGIPRGVAKKVLEIVEQKGRFTIFALVDALTRLAREQENAGDRTDADEKAIAWPQVIASTRLSFQTDVGSIKLLA
jgi:hypothetical protein